MKVAELLEIMKGLSPEQHVYVRLHTDRDPNGLHVGIQGVSNTPPWHGDGPNLVGIVCHDQNRVIRLAEEAKCRSIEKTKPTGLASLVCGYTSLESLDGKGGYLIPKDAPPELFDMLYADLQRQDGEPEPIVVEA